MAKIEPFETLAESDSSPTPSLLLEKKFGVAKAVKIVGFVEYIVIFPIVAIFSCGLAAICAKLAIEHFVGPGIASNLLAIMAALAVLIVVVRFAIHDYWRRAGSEVTFGADSITITHLGRTTSVDYEDVDAVRIKPSGRSDQFVFHLSGGAACRLPVEVASRKIVESDLENDLGPRIIAKYQRKIEAGNSVRVYESSFFAWLRMANSLLTFVMAFVCILSIKGIATGIKLWNEAGTKIRRGWRGRNCDFEVRSDGVSPSGSFSRSELCPWSSLRCAAVDSAGLILEFEHRRFLASVYADHYWPLSCWVKKMPKEL